MKLNFFLSIWFIVTNTAIWSQEAVVSVSKMNIVYVCMDNQLEIAMPNVDSKNLNVSIVEGQGELKNIGYGKYILHPTSDGYISLKIDAGDVVTTKKLVVKGIPNPTVTLNGNTNGIISMDLIKGVEKLNCSVFNFDYKVDCKIVKYVFSYKKRVSNLILGNYVIEDNVFNKNIKAILQNLQSGDRIIFTDIKSRCPCDNEDRVIGTVSFSIN